MPGNRPCRRSISLVASHHHLHHAQRDSRWRVHALLSWATLRSDSLDTTWLVVHIVIDVFTPRPTTTKFSALPITELAGFDGLAWNTVVHGCQLRCACCDDSVAPVYAETPIALIATRCILRLEVDVTVDVQTLFDYLVDHRRICSHMEKPSRNDGWRYDARGNRCAVRTKPSVPVIHADRSRAWYEIVRTGGRDRARATL